MTATLRPEAHDGGAVARKHLWCSDSMEFEGCWKIAVALLRGRAVLARGGRGFGDAAVAAIDERRYVVAWTGIATIVSGGFAIVDGAFDAAAVFRAKAGWQEADFAAVEALAEAGFRGETPHCWPENPPEPGPTEPVLDDPF